MEALQFKPSGFWRGDDTTPLQDYSGYARTATITGTEAHGVPLVAGVAYSQSLTSAVTATFATNVYQQTNEAQTFTLMATIYPIAKTTTGDQRILSNTGQFDGLAINGLVVSFTTRYTSAGTAVCSYNLDFAQKAFVVGVHTETKNMLYINGVLVDEIDLTTAQQADTYATSNGNLYSGGTSSTQGLLINDVATFPRALSETEIKTIYTAQNRVAGAEGDEVPKMYGGEVTYISSIVRKKFINQKWTEQDDWNSGEHQNTISDGDQLMPNSVDNMTVGGIWKTTIPLAVAETPVAINSLSLWWTGKNVLVQTSVDSTTWATATRGVPIAAIPTGFDPTGKSLHIRVTFTAGQTEAYLDNLSVSAYLTNTYVPAQGRTITYTNPIATFDEYPPTLLREDWGVKILTGTLSIGADGSGDAFAPKTVEMWIKRLDSGTITFSANLNGATSNYVNGVSGTTLPVGEWVLRHWVTTSTFTGAMTVNGNVQVGTVAVYPTGLAVGDTLEILRGYMGILETTVVDASTITISEDVNSVDIYAHDWEIVAS